MHRILVALLIAAGAFGADNNWPTYNGDYSGRRYSTLAQINPGNVNQLTVA